MKKYPSHGILEVTDLERRFRLDSKQVATDTLRSIRRRVAELTGSNPDPKEREALELLRACEKKMRSMTKDFKEKT
jgi:hypothetical protein